MKVTYPGPFDSIEVPALGAVVAQGEAVEVPDEVGEQLTAQGWTQAAPKKAAPKKAVKAEED